MNILSYYVKKFSSLRRADIEGEKAPHKPILLLSIIDSFERKEPLENKIYITPELVAQFKEYWHQLVHNEKFTPNFSLPFYHLKSDKFWHLQTIFGRDFILTSSHSIKSFAQLKDVVAYAYLDNSLFNLLIDKPTRDILRESLLVVYFETTHLVQRSENFIHTIINQILHEPAAAYKQRANTFDEEEVFVRGGVFKKEIPRIYNYTCCISGMRIITNKEVQMIDACHIAPFSVSHDDTISNGISLCPNLHRAFDRGLIAIDDEYRVLVKPFNEVDNKYSIKQFEGKRMLLPVQREYFPSQENLALHRQRFDF